MKRSMGTKCKSVRRDTAINSYKSCKARNLSLDTQSCIKRILPVYDRSRIFDIR
jgi:hypothetical protein